MSAILQVTDVHVGFGGVRALDGVSLAVRKGELFGLIGPNGSGKTTLIGVVSRLTHLTSGAMSIEGVDYTGVPAHAVNELGIARTFQSIRLLPRVTALQNVMLGAGASVARRPPIVNWLRIGGGRTLERRIREEALAALERVGMVKWARAYPEDLPYGSQRKIEIARALACNPKILLLDEPASGMTYAERVEVGDLLLELRDGGLTQVLVEHDLGMIHRLCSRVVALNFGKVVAEGTAAEVADDPDVREAYLGHTGDARDAGTLPAEGTS